MAYSSNFFYFVMNDFKTSYDKRYEYFYSVKDIYVSWDVLSM